MNLNPNRCRYCQNFFCCEAHRIDHEVKHHKKPNLPLWTKNKIIAVRVLSNKNINNIKNKQEHSNQIKENGTTKEKEANAKRLSRKRPHSFISTTENKVNTVALMGSVTTSARKILKPKHKNIKIYDIENNLNVCEKELSHTMENYNPVNKSNEEVSCVIRNKKSDAVNKNLHWPDINEQKVTNDIKKDTPLINTMKDETYKVPLGSCTSNKTQQDITEEVLVHTLLTKVKTEVLAENNLHMKSYHDATKQNISDENVDSPTDIKTDTAANIVSPVSDGGTPVKTSTPIMSDQEDSSLKINDNWCTASQNSTMSVYKTPIDQCSETTVGLVMSQKETDGNQLNYTPVATPLRGIMKNSKYNSPGNETLNSTSSLSKLRHVTFSDTPDNHVTFSDTPDNHVTFSDPQDNHLIQSGLSNEHSNTANDSPQLQGNNVFKTMADFVTSAFQSLPGFISSSFDKKTNSEMKFKVPNPAKRIRRADTESDSSKGYSPSHKQRCYHCYLKDNPIRKRRSISGWPVKLD